MWEKQISATPSESKEKIVGNHAFSKIIELKVGKKMHALFYI